MTKPMPRKLLVLLAAYGCFFLVVICTELGSTRIQQDLGGGNGGAGTTTACQQHGFSLLRSKQKSMVDSKEFKRHVQEVLRPQPHHTEKYVIKHNWQAYDGTREPYNTDTDVVMLLQASPGRLPFVRQLAERWQGPISLAVYIPEPFPEATECRENVLRYLKHDAIDHPFAVSFMYANGLVPNLGCILNAESTGFEDQVVDQVAFDNRFERGPSHRATWESVLPAEYPVNSLRTLAKDQVESNVFVFLGEADFMPVHSMHKKLRRGSTGTLLSEARHAWHSLGERRAIIVPAFEHLSHERIKEAQETALNATLLEPDLFGVQGSATGVGVTAAQKPKQHYLALWGWGQGACTDHDGNAPVRLGSSCWTYQGYSLPLTKPTLKEMVENGTITVFHEASFKAGHQCYDPHYWLEHDEPYEVSVRNPCEPYVIALLDTLPHFDQRFRGRLRDKVSILTQMAAWATRFFVSPDQFITHLPHTPAVPLATLAHDSTVNKYNFIIPHVLTQIMLEEMKEMSQMKHNVGHDVPDLATLQVAAQMASRDHASHQQHSLPEATASSEVLSTQQSPVDLESASTTLKQPGASQASGSLRAGGLPNTPAPKLSKPLFGYFSWDHVSSSSEVDSNSNSNSSSSSSLPTNTFETESGSSTSPDPYPSVGNTSSSVATSNTGHWEIRVTPQKEAHAMPSRSWLQELRGHFKRGGAALWGPDMESALSEGWQELAAGTIQPVCVVDWWATATVTFAFGCALVMVSWVVLRLL